MHIANKKTHVFPCACVELQGVTASSEPNCIRWEGILSLTDSPCAAHVSNEQRRILPATTAGQRMEQRVVADECRRQIARGHFLKQAAHLQHDVQHICACAWYGGGYMYIIYDTGECFVLSLTFAACHAKPWDHE
jgi:hypothetical protein